MQKYITLCLGLLIVSGSIYAQPINQVDTEIEKVTVFTQDAQIERTASLAHPKGRSVVKVTGLSPYINKESIRVIGDPAYTILSVQHQDDYLNELSKHDEIVAINQEIEDLERKIEEEEVRVKICNDKLAFLNANKEINGKGETTNPESFKTLNNYYGSKIEELNLELLKRNRMLAQYNEQIAKLKHQLRSLNSKSNLPSGTILVTIDAESANQASLTVQYRVGHASWYPSYDIRFLSLDKPLHITHKANIQQNTGIDWEDTEIVLSTAKTDISAQIPELSPFFLQFYYPQVADVLQGRVAGVQVEKKNTTGAVEEVQIRGVSSLKSQEEPLYVVDGVVKRSIASINPNDIAKIDVLKDASATAIYGSRGANGVVVVTTKKGEGNAMPMTINMQNETSNEFHVDAKQTVQSNNKTNVVRYRTSDLSSSFAYQSIPKLSEHVYLIGKVVDWQNAALLDGEAQLYFESSYVGNSQLDTKQLNDTLEISFGIDNNISIEREKLSDYSEKQFLGSSRKETLAFKITVQNNKGSEVVVALTDQVPVSTTKEIEVEPITLSGGALNEHTGKVSWKLPLAPGEKKEVLLKYSVKYPKDKKVRLE